MARVTTRGEPRRGFTAGSPPRRKAVRSGPYVRHVTTLHTNTTSATDHPSSADNAGRVTLGRRTLMGGGIAAGLVAFLGGSPARADDDNDSSSKNKNKNKNKDKNDKDKNDKDKKESGAAELGFTSIAPSDVDDVIIPD